LLERREGVIDHEALRANRVRNFAHLCRGDHGSHSATFKRSGKVIVSIVTRSVDSDEQLASTKGARIN
jgi:hypothetical protein